MFGPQTTPRVKKEEMISALGPPAAQISSSGVKLKCLSDSLWKLTSGAEKCLTLHVQII